MTCIDCDRPLTECSCESVLRCSCGIPDVVCVCAGNTPSADTDSASDEKQSPSAGTAV